MRSEKDDAKQRDETPRAASKPVDILHFAMLCCAVSIIAVLTIALMVG